MKFDLISKSVYRKHESSKSSDSSGTAKAFGATKEVKTTTKTTTKAFGTTKASTNKVFGATKKSRTSNKDYFRQRRQLKRRVKQAVQRYIKRALIQRKNRSLFT